MSDVVTGGVYNKTFSMTTLETTGEHLSQVSGRAEGRRDGWKSGKNFAGEFNVLDRFIARVAVVDSVEVRSAFEPLIRYKFEKIKTFRVHSREFLQSSLPIL